MCNDECRCHYEGAEHLCCIIAAAPEGSPAGTRSQRRPVPRLESRNPHHMQARQATALRRQAEAAAAEAALAVEPGVEDPEEQAEAEAAAASRRDARNRRAARATSSSSVCRDGAEDDGEEEDEAEPTVEVTATASLFRRLLAGHRARSDPHSIHTLLTVVSRWLSCKGSRERRIVLLFTALVRPRQSLLKSHVALPQLLLLLLHPATSARATTA